MTILRMMMIMFVVDIIGLVSNRFIILFVQGLGLNSVGLAFYMSSIAGSRFSLLCVISCILTNKALIHSEHLLFTLFFVSAVYLVYAFQSRVIFKVTVIECMVCRNAAALVICLQVSTVHLLFTLFLISAVLFVYTF